jgi:hypothetical protein
VSDYRRQGAGKYLAEPTKEGGCVRKLSEKTVELEKSDKDGYRWSTLIGQLQGQVGIHLVARQDRDGPINMMQQGMARRVRLFATTDPADPAIPPDQSGGSGRSGRRQARVRAKIEEIREQLGLTQQGV